MGLVWVGKTVEWGEERLFLSGVCKWRTARCSMQMLRQLSTCVGLLFR